MIRRMLPALLAVALTSSCASPGLLLEDAGDAYLVGRGERVPLSPDDALVIHWAEGDTTHTTADLLADGDGSGHVRLVEASPRFLHVWSEDWDKGSDLNQSLITGDLRLVPRTGRYRHPTVVIPVDRIAAVEVHPLLPRLKRPRWRDVWHGMAGGVTSAMAGFAAAEIRRPGFVDDVLYEPEDGSDFLLGTAVVGAAGAIVYPAYRLIPPRFADEPLEYMLGASGPYRLEIAAPR